MPLLFLITFAWATASQAMSLEEGKVFRSRYELDSSLRLAKPAESYKLPVGELHYQGETNLCWAYAMFHSLESRALVRQMTPLSLSRRAAQFATMSIRFDAYARDGITSPTENNWPIDAVSILRQWGALQFADVGDKIDNADYLTILFEVDKASSPEGKKAAAAAGLEKQFGAFPTATLWQGKDISRVEFGIVSLQGENWTSYRPSTSQHGWANDPEHDFPITSQVYFMTSKEILSKIRSSLRLGVAPVYCTTGHCVLIYGAAYNDAGKAATYYVMDSISGFFEADPAEMEGDLADIIALAPTDAN